MKQLQNLLDERVRNVSLDLAYQQISTLTAQVVKLQGIVDEGAKSILRDIAEISSPADSLSAIRTFDAQWFNSAPYSLDIVRTIASELGSKCGSFVAVPPLWRAISTGNYDVNREEPAKRPERWRNLVQTNTKGIQNMEELKLVFPNESEK
jgi:hypothetical protein